MAPGAPVAETAALPPSLLERYRPERLLGQGAYGRVVLARDLKLERAVAIKLLLPAEPAMKDHQNRVQRFLREARLMAKIRSPRVTAIHGVGVADGWPYLVSQFVQGQDLDAFLRARARPVPLEVATAMILQVLEGLQAIHAQGILHRDLKPANLLRGDDGSLVIADLGLGKAYDDEDLTRTGHVVGTFLYMAPEQMRGESLGPQADLYAAGLIFHELLVGSIPLKGKNAQEVFLARTRRAPPGPRACGVAVPRAVDVLLERALAPDPEDRPASGDEFAALLKSVLEAPDEPEVTDVRAPLGNPTEETLSRVMPAREAPSPAPLESRTPVAREAARIPGGAAAWRRRGVAAAVLGLGIALGFLVSGRRDPAGELASVPTPQELGPEAFSRDLDGFLRVIDEDPAIRAFLGVPAGTTSGATISAWREARRAYRSLFRRAGAGGLVSDLARVELSPDLCSRVARLAELELLLETGVAGEPALMEGLGTSVRGAARRWVRVHGHRELSLGYPAPRAQRTRRYLEALRAGGRTWTARRTHEELDGTEFGYLPYLRFRTPGGEPFRDPTWEVNPLITDGLNSPQHRERFLATPLEITFPISQPEGDLVLATTALRFPPERLLRVRLIGRDTDTVVAVRVPDPTPTPGEAGPPYYGFVLWISQAAIPPGVRRVRCEGIGIQALGSVASSGAILEVYQQTGGPPLEG